MGHLFFWNCAKTRGFHTQLDKGQKVMNTGSSTEHSVHRTRCPSANRLAGGAGRSWPSIFSKDGV